ncbi:MAG: DNRLRE domain-containing protein [Phycisphaerales bacterium]|nr:DNRLRE domain-containing protein [Phycisphaerales bacterium]
MPADWRIAGSGLGICLLGAASVLSTPAVHADSVTIMAAADTTLYESTTGALGNGAGQYLFAGLTNQPLRRRALLRFDVSDALLQGALIESVSLTLHASSTSALTHEMSLFRSTAAWGEGLSDASGNEGGGAPATAGDATWIHSNYTSSLWTMPGGDFANSASATALVGDMGFYTWSSSQLANDVESWLATPSHNFGWALLGVETSVGSAHRFDSSEGSNQLWSPALTIEFTPVPAPGALPLIAALLLRPRRRLR